ncbi:MAG: hypothetical protein ACO1OC_08410 [Tuberibacillus sp.]
MVVFNGVKKKYFISKEVQQSMKENQKQVYVEILSDTVSPIHVALSIIISLILGLGGFFIGKRVFPSVSSVQMVNSYSLLLGIVGCVLALALCSLLFHPKRVLTEADGDEGIETNWKELGIPLEEEKEVMSKDPEIRKEMEELKFKEIFVAKESGDEK